MTNLHLDYGNLGLRRVFLLLLDRVLYKLRRCDCSTAFASVKLAGGSLKSKRPLSGFVAKCLTGVLAVLSPDRDIAR
jgi:hypothetical protein